MNYQSSVYSFDIMEDSQGLYWIFRHNQPLTDEPHFLTEAAARARAWELY